MSRGTPEEIRNAAQELEQASCRIQLLIESGGEPTETDVASVLAANRRYTELTTGEPLRR